MGPWRLVVGRGSRVARGQRGILSPDISGWSVREERVLNTFGVLFEKQSKITQHRLEAVIV